MRIALHHFDGMVETDPALLYVSQTDSVLLVRVVEFVLSQMLVGLHIGYDISSFNTFVDSLLL